jgi:flagellin
VTGNARTQLNAQFGTLVQSVFNYIKGANYNGANLLLTNVPTGLTDVKQVIQDTNANQLTLLADGTNSPIGLLGGIFTVATTDPQGYIATVGPASFSDATGASALLTGGFATTDNYIKSSLNAVAAQTHFVDNQLTFNNAISDATTIGLGSLVDADLAKESAKLQSLQIKQQLGTQSLGIANQAPQSLLGLFR